MNPKLPKQQHDVDLCVVGGGMSGLCAAVAAARHGLTVCLIQDRPVLGGNASSEVRMWICGAHGDNLRETGLLEEIQLDNLRRNEHANWSIWDSVLFEKAFLEGNITLLLNASVNDLQMDGPRIRRVQAWQTTTQTWHVVQARYFADCSGDSILAPLSGAEFRIGREAREEFNEDIEPPRADRKTMGMSCLLQARQTDSPQGFVPPSWAMKYATCDDLPNRGHKLTTNYWWMELGGEFDSIHDTEKLRDRLLAVAFGVWDHVKNCCAHRDEYENWILDWVGFLPGKRESRRYVGDHILTQNDVRAEGRFDDLVAYGGWSMDDHHPGGIDWPGDPTIFHPAPSPYGIPYRCLYSKNVENLFFAGRNISATHAALSSTRVMATCSIIGQAVGTAAAIAGAEGLSPRGVYEQKIGELQQTLMDDDCYLPWTVREVSALSRSASLAADAGDAEVLRSGVDRPVGADENLWTAPLGSAVAYRFDKPTRLTRFRIVLDSKLNRPRLAMMCNVPKGYQPRAVPETLVKDFRIDVADGEGNWTEAVRVENNHRRLVRIQTNLEASAVRLVPESAWGADQARVFAFEVD